MQALRGVHQGRLLVSHGVPRPLPLPRGTVAVNANKPKVQVAVVSKSSVEMRTEEYWQAGLAAGGLSQK